MLTNSELNEIRERCEKATPGPELVRYEHGGGRSYIQTGDWESLHGKRDRKLVADYYNEEDREFYHSARADIPALLAHIDALESERQLLIAQQEKMCESFEKMGEQIKELESQIPRWIPVEERLPENWVGVIVYSEEMGVLNNGWTVDGKWFDQTTILDDITHWMPLPEGPEEEK